MTIGLAERDMAETMAEQEWLQPIDQALAQGFARSVAAAGPAGRLAQNFLHGTWLGHPLHPALTDVPIGAWTTALALDGLGMITGSDELAAGADAAVALGLAGALGSALAGVADWQATDGRARRIGLIHGLLNLGVTATYAASLVCRRRGARRAGLNLSLLGYAAVSYSAWLGGGLVYRERLGIDHSLAPDQSPPTTFVSALPEADLHEDTLTRGDANGVAVLLLRREGRIHALADSCSHLGCSLAEGAIEGNSVRCVCHGSLFSLDDGRVLDGPATMPQPVYAVRTRDGQIEVRADW